MWTNSDIDNYHFILGKQHIITPTIPDIIWQRLPWQSHIRFHSLIVRSHTHTPLIHFQQSSLTSTFANTSSTHHNDDPVEGWTCWERSLLEGSNSRKQQKPLKLDRKKCITHGHKYELQDLSCHLSCLVFMLFTRRYLIIRMCIILVYHTIYLVLYHTSISLFITFFITLFITLLLGPFYHTLYHTVYYAIFHIFITLLNLTFYHSDNFMNLRLYHTNYYTIYHAYQY